MKLLEGVKEKKVEYTELIYDLIFVYIIGQINSLLQNIQEGFVPGSSFLSYILCLLGMIQIWNFSTYYINMYGKNSARNHIFLFFNMFLLYFVGSATKVHWSTLQTRYHVAWGLILLNIAVQHFLELRSYKDDPQNRKSILTTGSILVVEAVIVFLAVVFKGIPGIILSGTAILFGMTATGMTSGGNYEAVDFMHLTERAMLFVVFTFGEMVVAIAGYFEGPVNFWNIYFAGMTFLVVVGLFLSYETLYDHIIDRELNTNGLGYMFLHVFMIFGLNNVSTALEFMHDAEVRTRPKMVFLVVSLIIYYAFLLATGKYCKPVCHKHDKKLYLQNALIIAVFVLLMVLLHKYMAINIAITVIFVFTIYARLYWFAKKIES